MKEPKINVYRCQYGCNTTTVDVDHGVTPFMIKCRRKSDEKRKLNPRLTDENGECVGTASSSFYPRGPIPPHIKQPSHEWYKPKNYDGLSRYEIDHVKRGGLLLRPRTDREPVYHEEENKK